MSDLPLDLPFGIDASTLAPSSMDDVDVKQMKRGVSTRRKKKKTPFQMHKEAKERRELEDKMLNDMALEQFKASLEATTSVPTFLRGGKMIPGQSGNNANTVKLEDRVYKMNTGNESIADGNADKPKKTSIKEFAEELKRERSRRSRPQNFGRYKHHDKRTKYENEKEVVIKISGLDSKITEDTLEGEYSNYSGNPVNTRIVYSSNHNIGYITCRNMKDAQKAIDRMNNKILYGKMIYVTLERDDEKDDRRILVKFPPEKEMKIIDHTAKFVMQNGSAFEGFLMNAKRNDIRFSFLYNVSSPSNIYYKWRVYSLLQGDTLNLWRLCPFQLFHGGPEWIPPRPVLFNA
eukprot:TRINITY_DN545_c0_g1_i1.p1 TRINITY_DN545_c0_g1~~TRINITY_DN545_c0_g1_i1.p1  ORF type:complete len:347 (-),score=74.48 TRINITY_DN545_c0_g1_i1:762-1802(-)